MIVVTLVSACGGGGGGNSASTDVTSTDQVTDVSSPSTEAPVVTEPATSMPAFDYITQREEPLWSDLVDVSFADFDNISGSVEINAAWAKLFAWPFVVPIPDDAKVSYALVDISPYEAEWYQRYALNIVSDLSVDDARTLVADYQNDFFTTGVMVESNLTDGDFFTYNFEATADAEAAGWYSFSITVGPETNIDGATGRTEVEFSLDRYVAAVSDLDVAFFLRGWMAEAPLNDSLEFSGIYANWSNLTDGGPNSLDVEITFTADQTRWVELIEYFGKDWVQDGLVMESPYVPDDPNSTDYVPLASFATMGSHAFDLILERDTSDSTLPMKVRYGVSVGVQM
jgi:hypothetical protein